MQPRPAGSLYTEKIYFIRHKLHFLGKQNNTDAVNTSATRGTGRGRGRGRGSTANNQNQSWNQNNSSFKSAPNQTYPTGSYGSSDDSSQWNSGGQGGG